MAVVVEQEQARNGTDPYQNVPHPIPFGNLEDLPAFPVDAIPDATCRDMVAEVSHIIQIDTGFTYCCLLGVLSVTAQGKFVIDLITHREHPNLYVVGILESGERKSPTIRAMARPVYAYQDLQKCVVVCNDVTTEKLAVLMSGNEERMAIISAEGGIFDIMAGRYSEGWSNFDLYLQAYSQDPLSIHRINRESVRLNSPSLTLCLGVQPTVLERIGSHREFRGRGLLARFLYARCRPQAGHRVRLDRPISGEIEDRYHNHIMNLMQNSFPEPVILALEPDAQEVWNNFYLFTENEMQLGGVLYDMRDWGSKLPGAVARMAGLFHYARYGAAIGEHPISVNIVRASCDIARYFMAHAQAVLTIMREPKEVQAARKILDYIKRIRPETFKGRDVLRHTNLQSMAEVSPGLAILFERHFIKVLPAAPGDRPGRPEAISYKVNPRFLAGCES